MSYKISSRSRQLKWVSCTHTTTYIANKLKKVIERTNCTINTIDPSNTFQAHYDDVIMDAMASRITSLMIVYSTVYSGADQSKHQSSASLAFVWGIHRGPVNSPHKWPVTRKMSSFDDVIMLWIFHRMYSTSVRNPAWWMRCIMPKHDTTLGPLCILLMTHIIDCTVSLKINPSFTRYPSQ